jgi:type III secretion inner rod protein HrpB2
MNITSPLQASATDILAHASAPGESMTGLAEKFASIMGRASNLASTETAEPSSVASVLINQDEMMRKNIQSMEELTTAQTAGLSDRELTQRHIELVYQVSTTQFQFNACTYVAQSSKNGLQTLMRNQ